MTLADIKERAELAIVMSDPDRLLDVINEAHAAERQFSEQDQVVLKAHISRWRGVRCQFNGEYQQSIELLNSALDQYNSLKLSIDAARCLGNVGAVQNFLGNYKEALEIYQRSYSALVEHGDIDGSAAMISNIANIYVTSGDYSSALERYHEAVAIHRSRGNQRGIALVLGNIGNIFKERSEIPRALEYYHESLAIYEEIGDRSGIGRLTGSIGGIYFSTSDYPLALEFFNRALSIQEDLNDRFRVARQVANIASVYRTVGEFSAALEWFERSLRMQEDIGDKFGIAHVVGSIGEVYSDLKRFDEAEEWLRKSLSLLEPLGIRREAAYYSSALVGLMILREEFEGAQTMLEKYIHTASDLPDPLIGFLECKATLMHRNGDIDGSVNVLHEALDIAYKHGLRNQQVFIHQALRENFRDSGPLNDYVEHTEAIERLTRETLGIEQQRKLAITTVERRVSNERKEAERHRALLHNVMPEAIASRILKGEKLIADELDDVAVFFLDLVSFTELSSRVAPGHLIHLLNAVFNSCDEAMRQHGITKIKTIGDAYMAAAGAPVHLVSDEGTSYANAMACALAALDLRDKLDALEVIMPPELGDVSWVREIGQLKVRMGINIGPLVAGVVGTDRVAYDVWGDAVNVAARMEQSCEPGRIQVSDEFAKALSRSRKPDMDENGRITIEWQHGILVLRGSVNVKGKGDVKTWWLERIQQ